jgi:type IV pilus assembly protein PilB
MQTNNFADFLVKNNILSAQTAQSLINNAKQENISFITYLLISKNLSYATIAEQSAIFFDLKTINLTNIDISKLPLNLIDKNLIEQYTILPLAQENNILTIALADPTNTSILNEIKFRTNLTIKLIIAEYDKLTSVVNSILYAGRYDDLHHEDTHVIKLVDQILTDAINRHASDIHFELFATIYRIRFRIDGIMHEIINLEPNIANRIIARLKIIAKLDIAERRLPQDGRFNIIFDEFNKTAFSYVNDDDDSSATHKPQENHETNRIAETSATYTGNEKITPSANSLKNEKPKTAKQKQYDCRINFCPTLHGEKIVVRILNPGHSLLTIKELGLAKQQLHLFLKTIKRPQGMILVTGPTGSGKTVSLYAALNQLNQIDKNISTVEDPIEINLPGINQVNINPKIGLDFVTILRSFLRQDPDIIMIGEIRDLETAEIAIKAAQTGHLVLSTLHTNSAAESITRLLNMGISAFNLESSLSLIIAQRLIRKLCPHCKQPQQIPAEMLLEEGFASDEITNLVTYVPIGCKKCNHGFYGRLGIFELLPISINISKIIMEHKSSSEIFYQAISEGMISLRKHALEKVKQGITSITEINRIT